MSMTANCLNGEIKPGDLVISTSEDNYPCLVGTVLSIGKMQYSEQEYIFVDFMHPEYSDNRLQEIEQMLGDAYGRPTTPGIWPLDIDNLPMRPESLIRITGISDILKDAILDSAKAAEALCRLVQDSPAVAHETLLGVETPAQAALHEPDIYDSPETAALREQLLSRLDSNFVDYFNTLRGCGGQELTAMTSEISARCDAHYYLSEIHNFHTSELQYLLQFQNPLEVVADQFRVSGLDNRSDIMWDIFDRKDALGGDYPLMPEPTDDDILRKNLFEKLDRNFADNMAAYRVIAANPTITNTDIIVLSVHMASLNSARTFLKEDYNFRKGELDLLASMEHPLDAVALEWPYIADYIDTDEGMHDFLETGGSIVDMPLMIAKSQESVQEKGPSDKASVLAQIREAAKAPKEPAPKPAPDKHTPER